MQTIIVPTDLSANAANAAHYACDMAASINADILLMHVVALPVTISEVPVPPQNFDIMIEDATRELETLKSELLQHCGAKVNIALQITLGELMEELEETASKIRPVAIIMGSQGSGSVERLIFGSNSLAAMRRLSWPLILVPRSVQFKGIKKTALACDLKNVAGTVSVKKIENFMSLFHSTFDILYVSDADEKMNSEVLSESVALQNSLSSLHADVRFIISKDIESGISDFVNTNGIDLLMVISKKHDFLNLIFHKSVSKEIAMHTHIPILTINA